MKLSYNWLKDFVDISVDAEDLSKTLFSIGLEVDSITRQAIPEGVVVGKVTEWKKHPNADKLSLCTVDVGADEPLSIVCGAPNARKGLTVACATVGTKLAPDFTIKKAKIRGEKSFGMLCAEDELGISENHEGIMELSENLQAGTPLSELYPEDIIFELEITPDRGDCLSVRGVAREVANAYGKEFKSTARIPRESGGDITSEISVSIENAELCPRYMGRLIRNITIAPSPAWMKERLSAAGLRPINNIVDITNYILLEYGQPMHAFDYTAITDKKIIVKNASAGQKFTTLDDKVHELTDSDLLICDGSGGVALAGVMGGAGSEIQEGTTDVFLECAYFEPVGIRMTARRLGISTDSSYRFERGVDPNEGLEAALDTAAELMRDLGGGEIVSGKIDEYPRPCEGKKISIRPAQASRLIGVPFTADTIKGHLSGLEFTCISDSAEQLDFVVPYFRHDVTIEADLIEEVGRLHGYDNLPVKDSGFVPLNQSPNKSESKIDTIRKSLAFFGLNEIVTNSMTSEANRQKLTPDVEPVRMLNPLNPEMSQLRTNLLGNHLQIIHYNNNRKNVHCRLFEVGRVFKHKEHDVLPEERLCIAISLEGEYFEKNWESSGIKSSFYILKGLLESFATHARLGAFTFEKYSKTADNPFFSHEAATLHTKSGTTGYCGMVRSDLLQSFDISQQVVFACLDITDYISAAPRTATYQSIPKFPAVERSFAFIMPDTMEADVISREIYSISSLVRSVVPFDLYQGEKIDSGKKSLAFSVKLQSDEKTLGEQEATDISDRIIAAMQEKHSVSLRV